jgi:pimeloyl-ACP methyl ester carboxylesterase
MVHHVAVTFVLVHGGGHSSRCWEPTLPYLAAPAVCVDLPGRGRRPGPLDRLRLADSVDAVVEDLVGAGDDPVVLVGHSMAGLVIPAVLERVPERVRHLVLISCAIPPDGGSLLDLLPPEIVDLVREQVPTPEGAQLTAEAIRVMQCYDMDEAQTQFTVEVSVSEAFLVIREPVDLSGLRQPVARTWIKPVLDQSFPPALQDVMARRAGCDRVVELDSGHTAMISHPVELARLLNEVHASSG